MKGKHKKSLRGKKKLLERGVILAAKLPKMRMGLTRIKVIGVGGGGNHAVSRMMESERLKGVEFIAVNTDAQDLDYTSAHRKVLIGKALTHGLGAGMNTEIGKQAAEENRSEIGEVLDGADIVFITAGFGGGTGTAASPIIAETAREKGILTVAVVTKPFTFEGSQRMNIAQDGLTRIKDKVDALVVIPNDRIFNVINKDTPLTKAFGYIDDVLRNAVRAIAELVNVPGIINVDFADIKATLKDAGSTLIGIGIASGGDRAQKAVSTAINSPLLDTSMEGAKGVLFSIAGGRDLKMAEIHDIAKTIAGNLDAQARVIFGAYHDRNLRDKSLKVTVIATGFNGIFGGRMGAPSLFVTSEPARGELFMGKSEEPKEIVQPEELVKAKPAKETQEKSGWEIPAFMRKRRR
jgi:cell division protein FtsZ